MTKFHTPFFCAYLRPRIWPICVNNSNFKFKIQILSIMKHFGKIISISAMNERSFTTQQGEQRVTAEIGVVVSDGIDC